MKEAGIFYGSSSGKTESVAMRIHERLGKENSRLLNIAESSAEDFLEFSLLILGVPTWGIGNLQDDWMEFLPRLRALDLSGKKVALFGLGNQESYPDTFADAMGRVHDSLLKTGCEIIAYCSTRGYDFTESGAMREGRFVGLILDEENQPELTDKRIDEWLKGISANLEESLN